MILRTYQREALAAVEEKFRDHQSTMVVMPTGSGKTVFASELMKRQEGRCMFLVHRDELGDQAVKTAREFGLTVDREQGDQRSNKMALFNIGKSTDVTVTTVQTQISGRNGYRRMQEFGPNEFDLLVVDEAHHSLAKSWSKTIKYYGEGNPRLKVLYMTATADRHDGLALRKMCESVAYVYDIEDAIQDGWLVEPVTKRTWIDELDFSRIKKTAGDLNQKELAETIEAEKVLQGIADTTHTEADGRKTLVFTVSVKQAEKLAEILNRHEHGCAKWICGKTNADERRMIIEQFHLGKFKFLVNVGIATEGFDCPTIEVIAMARPTLSRPLCSQMIGRGLRPWPKLVDTVPDDGSGQHLIGENGSPLSPADARRKLIAESRKPHCLVLDFVGNSGRHRLACCADILGGKYSDDEIELAERIGEQQASGPRNVRADLTEARRRLIEQKRKEEEKRKHIIGKAKYRTSIVNQFDVLGTKPSRPYGGRGWQSLSITDGQRKMLKIFRYPTEGLDRGEASRIIGECIERRNRERRRKQDMALLRNRKGIV